MSCPCAVTLLILGEQTRTIESASREDIQKAIDGPDPFWLDLAGFTKEQAPILLEQFHFHHLSVEDCLDTIHYPKIEQYPEYLFVVLHAVENHGKQQLTTEVDSFITSKALVTVHQGGCRVVNEFRRSLLNGRAKARLTSDLLFHAMTSKFMDEYFPLLDLLNQEIERIQDTIFYRPKRQKSDEKVSGSGETVRQFLGVKKRITKLRRLLTAQRDVFNRLTRDEFPLISPQAVIYFRDVYDRLFGITEMLDSYRDVLASTLEAHLSVVSNRLNEVMKLLTVVTVIFMPLMLITGIYGMNFEIMPELHNPWGYPIALFSMGLLTAGLIWYFKRRRWL
jgi:magnesium transporter